MRSPSQPGLRAWSLALALMLAAPLAQAAEGVSTATQAANLLRALTHDRNFARRFGAELTVAVLYKPGDAASARLAASMESALVATASSALAGREVRVLRIEYRDEDSLAGAVHGSKIGVLYVCPQLATALAGISGVARKRDIVTVGATRAMVEGGLSFGIVEVEGKARIVVNLTATREEGTKFNAQLLRMAEVVQGEG